MWVHEDCVCDIEYNAEGIVPRAQLERVGVYPVLSWSGWGCTPCSVGVGGDGGAPPTQLEQVEVEGIMGEGAPQNEKDGNDW